MFNWFKKWKDAIKGVDEIPSYPSRYTERDLRYSAIAKCPCGAGLAYPIAHFNSPTEGYWDCSKIWLGTADKNVQHTDRLPWIFYDIRSEDASKNETRTTRPGRN